MYLYSLNSLSAANAYDKFEPIAKWVTIAVIAALLLVGIVLFFAKRKAFVPYAKYALFGLFCFLLAVGIAALVLNIAKHYSDEYTEENWLDKSALVHYVLLPLCILAVLTLVSFCAYAALSKVRPEAKRTAALVGIALCAVALVASLVCLGIYYNKKIKGDGYYNSDTASVKQIALYLSTILLVAAVGGLSLFDKRKFSFDTKSLAYAGVCIAMSFALSYIKLWEMPQGGSVTLASLLPLMVYAYMFGAKKGVFAGFVYGILQAVQDAWIIHPAQFLLDYPVAFAAIGLAGLFSQIRALDKLPQLKFTFGALLASLLRFVSHVLSGVFAFAASANGGNVLLYSLGYNSFVFIDIAIAIVAGVLVFSSKSFVTAVNRVAAGNLPSSAAETGSGKDAVPEREIPGAEQR